MILLPKSKAISGIIIAALFCLSFFIACDTNRSVANPAIKTAPVKHQKTEPVLNRFTTEKLTIDIANGNPKFPDRIIASKTIRGKFIDLVSGDYLYAEISTARGENTFLIDGDEYCFLQQYPKEQLRIDYDVVDRYTPQAGGYRRVNIIRNITSRQTNLRKWRRTLTKKVIDKCENNLYR
jgi:hypothetical protein